MTMTNKQFCNAARELMDDARVGMPILDQSQNNWIERVLPYSDGDCWHAELEVISSGRKTRTTISREWVTAIIEKHLRDWLHERGEWCGWTPESADYPSYEEALIAEVTAVLEGM